MRLGVLVSGTGTLMEAILDAGLEVRIVVADRPCRALEIASKRCVETALLGREFGPSFDRDAYSAKLAELLRARSVDLVAMAGFGTILGKPMFEAYGGRILNSHPALLPSFPGWHAVRDALAYGVKVTGCTIHVATEKVDDGPILAQRCVEVLDSDTEQSLHERIKQVERVLYPRVIREFMSRLQEAGS
jgi:phosphoribosylglycinamide formyltransferase-1